MGNLIKINLYAELKNKKQNKVNIKKIEEIILNYNSWLRNTNREDKIENYEKFLRAQ
ncbi:hypothetical protein [Clostridium sp. YIM B02555]|uniref:hypothetical protein n=1 Tax=Clostridium sp. YIM B02555 TaxID=2911968 RepID=UPI001EEF02F3|nr:hypothetical protein [Clostridium sp. YIM B02555]